MMGYFDRDIEVLTLGISLFVVSFARLILDVDPRC